ncbi:MAG: RidA family protein [Candidatus Absconditabacteria bacterium]
MQLEIINTDKAPKAIGPYSQGVKVGDFVYLSGQIGLDAQSMNLVEGIENQTTKICHNIEQLLLAAGTNFSKVVKTTIFLTDLNDFQIVNSIYAQYFVTKPARSTVQVSALPKGASIEIEVIAGL